VPEVAARLRYLRSSAPKVRQVLGLIRGLDAEDARDTLEHCERGVADEVMKLLDSAIANAEHNENIPVDELFVHRAFVDEGPTLKRWRPRARGRGTRIRKRTSHLTIIVSRFADDELERRRDREAIEGPPRRRPLRRRSRMAEAMAEQAEPGDEPDHDHDHELDSEGEAGPTVKKAPAKKRAPAKKKAPAKKTRVKKTTKKSTKRTRKKDE